MSSPVLTMGSADCVTWTFPSWEWLAWDGLAVHGYSHRHALRLQQSWKKQNLFLHGLISHHDKAVPDFHKSTFHCSHMRAFQSLLALFSLILHFILLSSSFFKCQGEHLSSLHHRDTQRHLSARGCGTQMPATFNGQKAAYLQIVYSLWGNNSAQRALLRAPVSVGNQGYLF